MTRRKSSTPAEPEEGAYEIPPPSAIGRMPSDSSRRAESEESGYGLDLELLASDKPPRADSANGMNAQESGHAPVLESSPAPISDESPYAPKLPRALEMHQEYGLELEVLAASESDESPDAPEPPQEDDESASSMVESAAESVCTPMRKLSATPHLSMRNPWLRRFQTNCRMNLNRLTIQNHLKDIARTLRYWLRRIQVSRRMRPSRFREDEASSSVPVAPDLPLEQPEAPLETTPVENGFYPLVRDARGNWRPGKGFSRSELQEAGLSLSNAAHLHIRIDKRRRNAHRMNVATLEKAKKGA